MEFVLWKRGRQIYRRLALDKPLLHEPFKRHAISNSLGWKWDTDDYPEYNRISTRNGFYTPSDDHLQIWPVIRELHFVSIQKAAKYLLREKSRYKCDYRLLDYLKSELATEVPIPEYLSHFNTIKEIESFKDSFKNTPETEREAIIQSRIGQEEFRNRLIKYWKGCAVTGCKFLLLLRASHIKPWKDSTNDEHLDLYTDSCSFPIWMRHLTKG